MMKPMEKIEVLREEMGKLMEWMKEHPVSHPGWADVKAAYVEKRDLANELEIDEMIELKAFAARKLDFDSPSARVEQYKRILKRLNEEILDIDQEEQPQRFLAVWNDRIVYQELIKREMKAFVLVPG